MPRRRKGRGDDTAQARSLASRDDALALEAYDTVIHQPGFRFTLVERVYPTHQTQSAATKIDPAN